jgi:hypothetical protein
MTRTATGLCVAAAFGFVAATGAQTPTSSATGQTATATSRDAKDIDVTGCLQRSADGKFILTNARVDSNMTRPGTTGTTGSTAAGTTGTTSTATTAAGSTATATVSDAANTWTLNGGQDLDKHVGHKVQVTGRAAMDMPRKDDDVAKGTTSTATGSTATTGTTGATGGATTAGEQRRSDRETKDSGPRLEVKSVTMIASSCS